MFLIGWVEIIKGSVHPKGRRLRPDPGNSWR